MRRMLFCGECCSPIIIIDHTGYWPSTFAGPIFQSTRKIVTYFFLVVVEEPVVVWWPGAYSEAPGAVDFCPVLLASCILCPGAYSEAPGPLDGLPVSCAFCICWPGALLVVGDCANADEANSIAPATIENFLSM